MNVKPPIVLGLDYLTIPVGLIGLGSVLQWRLAVFIAGRQVCRATMVLHFQSAGPHHFRSEMDSHEIMKKLDLGDSCQANSEVC